MGTHNRGGTGGRGGADHSEPSNVLYMTNLSYSVSEEIVKTTFADAGFAPKTVVLLKNP
jgi:hypothetical protein